MQRSEYFYVLVIFTLFHAKLVISRPVPNVGAIAVHVHLPHQMQRAQRQVVQPTWLADKSLPIQPVDGMVHINQKNLQEAAELRDAIRKAVNEGRFAVDIEQDQPPQAPFFNAQQPSVLPAPQPPLAPILPVPATPFGPLPLAPLIPAPWAVPQMAPWRLVDPQQTNVMQRMWSDFMENTRRMWERN